MTELSIDELPEADYSSRPHRQYAAEGQPAAFSRVNLERIDLSGLKQILAQSPVKRWMSGVRNISDREIVEWARDEILFAIRGRADAPQEDVGELIGFINVYTPTKALAERLIKKGFVSKADSSQIREVSVAIDSRKRYRSGLVHSALLQVILQVTQWDSEMDFRLGKLDYNSTFPSQIILAFTHSENQLSKWVLEKAGFKNSDVKVKYHGNSKQEDEIWLFDWERGSKLLRGGQTSVTV